MKRIPECTLNVSSLTRNVREDHLREIFGLYGVVTTCTVAIDKGAGIPKGYAYVEFDSVQEAEAARERLNGGMLDGRAMRVEFCTHIKQQRQAEKSRAAQAAAAAEEKKKKIEGEISSNHCISQSSKKEEEEKEEEEKVIEEDNKDKQRKTEQQEEHRRSIGNPSQRRSSPQHKDAALSKRRQKEELTPPFKGERKFVEIFTVRKMIKESYTKRFGNWVYAQLPGQHEEETKKKEEEEENEEEEESMEDDDYLGEGIETDDDDDDDDVDEFEDEYEDDEYEEDEYEEEEEEEKKKKKKAQRAYICAPLYEVVRRVVKFCRLRGIRHRKEYFYREEMKRRRTRSSSRVVPY